MSSANSHSISQAFSQARGLFKQGELDRALKQTNELLKAVPENIPALFLKGVIHRRSGNVVEACDVLNRVANQVPELAAAQLELGLALYSMRRLDEAKDHLLRSVELDKSLTLAWKRLGEIYSVGGEEEKASDAFRNQLLASKKHPGLVKAIELVAEGKLGMAEGICREYLKRFPADVTAIRLLAEIGLKLGIFAEARMLLERCLELAPDFHLARNNYANALGKVYKFDEAIKEIQYLEQAEPNNLSHPVLSASLLARAGRFEDALNKYEHLLTLVPQHAGIWTSYGHCLKTVGRQNDSIDAYRSAIAFMPERGEAYWSLANLKTFQFEEEELRTMRDMVDRSELERSDRFHLYFAVGKALEDNGDYDTAFGFYELGNQLKKEQSGYQADDTTAMVRSSIECCSAEMFDLKQGFGNSARDPIFIVGLPRSGSTLLEQILASHSQVEGTEELPYLSAIVHRLAGKKRRSDPSKYPQILWDLSDDECSELGQEYLDAAQKHRSGEPLFIDKMPNNFAHVGLINMILPNAKIIDARRHPIATCFSCYKQLFAAGQEFTYSLEDIGRYYIDYLAMMHHWDSVLPGKVLLVEYEKVINEFENQVRCLLDFCQLEFEPACLEFYASKRAVRTASSEQVRQPIYTGALEHWRYFEDHLQPLKAALTPPAPGGKVGAD